MTTETPTDTPLPDDWQPFENETISIAVPANYVGGDPRDDHTIAAIRALGAECVAAADVVSQFRKGYAFSAVDADTCATDAVRTLHVLVAESSTTTLSAFAEEYVMRLSDQGSLLDYKEKSIGGLPAALMQVRRDAGASATIQAIYAVRAQASWYVVVAAASDGDFAAAASGFDAIAATFRVR